MKSQYYSREYLKKYEVPTIPAFKIIKSDGTLAVDKARFDVQVGDIRIILYLIKSIDNKLFLCKIYCYS